MVRRLRRCDRAKRTDLAYHSAGWTGEGETLGIRQGVARRPVERLEQDGVVNHLYRITRWMLHSMVHQAGLKPRWMGNYSAGTQSLVWAKQAE